MKLDYLEMLHAEFEVSSLNSMAVREIIRWAKKICDNNNRRTTTTDGQQRTPQANWTVRSLENANWYYFFMDLLVNKTSVNKYGYQYGCTLWVNKLGLEIIHLNKGQHWEKILGQEWNFVTFIRRYLENHRSHSSQSSIARKLRLCSITLLFWSLPENDCFTSKNGCKFATVLAEFGR